MGNKIKATEQKTSEYKIKYQESVRTMASLKDGISCILNKIGISSANSAGNCKAMLDMIKNTGVTESNVMEILGVIEQKTNRLIASYVQLSTTDENKENIANAANNQQNKAVAETKTKTATTTADEQLDDKQAEA